MVSGRKEAGWCCQLCHTHTPAPSAPAAVTGLVFLQVPAYPEVFRDGLHTFKLNEQDTDVRAALPAPSDTTCSSCCPPHPCFPLWGFSFTLLPLPVAFHPFDSPLLVRTTTQCSTCFLLLRLLLLDMALSHPPLSLCFMLRSQAAGPCLQQWFWLRAKT